MLNKRNKNLNIFLFILLTLVGFSVNFPLAESNRINNSGNTDVTIEQQTDFMGTEDHLNTKEWQKVEEDIKLKIKEKKMDLSKIYVNKKKVEEGTVDSGFYHIEGISMPKEHQRYLYDLCIERDLDYLKVMAVISLESNFKQDLISKTNDYGYMQINIVNHKRLSGILSRGNGPLDPYVNLNWGTYLLEELYNAWEKENVDSTVKDGEVFSKLDKYVMSSYNKGLTGFKRGGMATRYINLIEDRYRKLKEGI